MSGLIHQPCPDCGSSAALQINTNSTFCHSCHKYTPTSDDYAPVSVPESTAPKAKPDFSAVERTLTTGNYQAIMTRGLTTATAKTYGILEKPDKTYFAYHDPEDANVPVAAKIRLPDKQFYNVGNWAASGLFGQQLFNGGGKYITLCEGEFDAAAAYQMQGSKYACVSVRNGAGGALKDCKAAYEYLDSFEAIIICFDADEAGNKAAKEVAERVSGKAAIV